MNPFPEITPNGYLRMPHPSLFLPEAPLPDLLGEAPPPGYEHSLPAPLSSEARFAVDELPGFDRPYESPRVWSISIDLDDPALTVRALTVARELLEKAGYLVIQTLADQDRSFDVVEVLHLANPYATTPTPRGLLLQMQCPTNFLVGELSGIFLVQEGHDHHPAWILTPKHQRYNPLLKTATQTLSRLGYSVNSISNSLVVYSQASYTGNPDIDQIFADCEPVETTDLSIYWRLNNRTCPQELKAILKNLASTTLEWYFFEIYDQGLTNSPPRASVAYCPDKAILIHMIRPFDHGIVNHFEASLSIFQDKHQLFKHLGFYHHDHLGTPYVLPNPPHFFSEAWIHHVLPAGSPISIPARIVALHIARRFWITDSIICENIAGAIHNRAKPNEDPNLLSLP